MKLTDLFSMEDLQKELDANNVSSRASSFGVTILSYTNQAMWGRHWNDVTLNCRGLIYNTDTLDIIASPFKKFFNYGEPSVYPDSLFQGPMEVSKKLDGWLGIIYRDPQGTIRVSTRGNTESDVSVIATDMLSEYTYTLPADTTFLVEIIHPMTAIICDYHGEKSLNLIGVIHNSTGEETKLTDPIVNDYWNGPITDILSISNIKEVLEYNIPSNEEGFVVHYTDTGGRLKFKGEQYKTLARMHTHCSPRMLWFAFKDTHNFNREELFNSYDDNRDFVKKSLGPLLDKFDSLCVHYSHAVKDYSTINKETAQILIKQYGKEANKYINTIKNGPENVAWKEVKDSWKSLM